MIEKVMVCPYFGDLPPWMEHWYENAIRMTDHGYTFVLDHDEDAFKDRVREILDIEPPRMAGTGNVWDFRPAFGLLYAEEIGDADFWGHTDFDCVYGRVENWVTPEALDGVDILSNHDTYVCGPWTLYRNSPVVNSIFFRCFPEWQEQMERDGSYGWVEKGYSEEIDRLHRSGLIVRHYRLWQTKTYDSFDSLRLYEDGRLMEGDTEVMLAHFRRTKTYPRGCML